MSQKSDEVLPPQKPPRKIGCYLLGCFGLIFILLVMAFFPFNLRSPNLANFTACKETLTNIKTGLEAQLSEKGNLKNIDQYGNQVCHHILAGYNEAKECENLGLIKKRVDSVCRAGYKVKILDKNRY